ncbi:DNA methylase [Mycobacterium phage Familton]|nr:DNA methylase [Mycobacterium phage Familton]
MSEPTSDQPWAEWDPISATWQEIPGESEQFSGTWPTSGSMRNGKLYQRPTRERPTDANEYSLLPTPVAADANRGRSGHGRGLTDAILNLAEAELFEVTVPMVDMGSRRAGIVLAIEHWASLTRPAPPAIARGRRGKLRVNPAFAEWMMGWPDGWVTGLELSHADRLWIIGNGVCPQQAVLALTTLGVTP